MLLETKKGVKNRQKMWFSACAPEVTAVLKTNVFSAFCGRFVAFLTR